MAAAAAWYIMVINDNEEAIAQQNRVRILNRHLRDHNNPFELPNSNFVNLFRLNKEATQYVIDTLIPHLHQSIRSTAIPNYLKILCTLHFLGHGSYQGNIGANAAIGVSQPVVSRCILHACNSINEYMLNEWIKFPTDQPSINNNKNLFFEKCRFPDILGVIDCTHVAIIAPPLEHEIYPAPVYYNRKGYYSINVQIIADASLKILNMNARYPGSVHDAAIWTMSSINRHLHTQYINDNLNYHLIGDEGYPMSPWLLIQHQGNHVENSPEGRFNTHLRRGRMTIERLNGVLKGRFRCLLKHRTLNYNPIKAAKIIYSCGVLHNIATHFNVDMPEYFMEHEVEHPELDVEVPHHNYFLQGLRKRERITQLYFNRN